MIDIGLEVEMTLEVGLEVEEDQANPVLIATSPTMIFLTVTNSTMVYTTTYIEAINIVTIMANLEAEAVVAVEVITMDAVTAGLITDAITIINTISIMVMMMTTSPINMAHHVHYVVAIIIPQNIVLRRT